MVTKLEDSSPATKQAMRDIATDWRVVQKEVPLLSETVISFPVPAGAKMGRIQGLIVAPAGLIQPMVTFNNLTTAIYNQVKINTTSSGDAAADETIGGSGFQFTSSFASSESSLIDVTFPIHCPLARQLFKGIGFNNGGLSGDYHTTVGWAADAADISSAELRTVAPFANGFAPGSFFTFSVLE